MREKMIYLKAEIFVLNWIKRQLFVRHYVVRKVNAIQLNCSPSDSADWSESVFIHEINA